MNNPKYPNLTNAGKGRPKLDRDRINIGIDRELLSQLDRYCEVNRCSRPDAIEVALNLLNTNRRTPIPRGNEATSDS